MTWTFFWYGKEVLLRTDIMGISFGEFLFLYFCPEQLGTVELVPTKRVFSVSVLLLRGQK